ncbi:MAG: hypothetical protein IPO32_00155 [Crocinitomicaceae bacterium]|jgi:hypothetical protein|nr:hypothetical protein [Crocinitomicaceae bacterium]MBK9589947.1 hypothetical protein [Crocinitomicaceae bacterium]
MRYFIFSFALLAITLSCNKEPGRGGTSSITGKVHVYNINSIGDTTDEYYAMDEDVFIIYGDNDLTYDDKFSCSYDGSYRFDYLTPGEYTIFAYSRCDTCDDGVTPVFKTIQIQDKKTEYSVSDLNILK